MPHFLQLAKWKIIGRLRWLDFLTPGSSTIAFHHGLVYSGQNRGFIPIQVQKRFLGRTLIPDFRQVEIVGGMELDPKMPISVANGYGLPCYELGDLGQVM